MKKNRIIIILWIGIGTSIKSGTVLVYYMCRRRNVYKTLKEHGKN